VVDWHSGIAAEVERVLPGVDGAAFALAWRAGYQPAMKAVMERIAAGEGGFTLLDELHLSMLEQVLRDFGLGDRLDSAAKRDLSRAWHRLPAWPDSVAGLTRLKKKFTICTLSNGNIGLLTEMAKRAGLPWDCVLSAEVFKAYKPDPRTYLGVAGVFDATPGQVMLAAAHHDDLAAARVCGLKTATSSGRMSSAAQNRRTCRLSRTTTCTRATSTSWPTCSAAERSVDSSIQSVSSFSTVRRLRAVVLDL
jgi:2-haloacid dehalogenase